VAGHIRTCPDAEQFEVMHNANMSEYYSPREAAERLPYSERHIRRLLRSGKLKGQLDQQGHWRIPKDALPANSDPQQDRERLEQERLEQLSEEPLSLLTPESIIALLGASAGYIGFVWVLLFYPIGVVTLWLRLLGSGYTDDYGDAWYAAWLVPETAIVPNVLLVLLFSLIIASVVFAYVAWEAFKLVVGWYLILLVRLGFDFIGGIFRGIGAIFGVASRQDDQPKSEPEPDPTWSQLVTEQLKRTRHLLRLLIPSLGLPSFSIVLAIVLFGVYSPLRLTQFWLVTAVPLVLASVIAMYLLVPVGDYLYREGVRQERGRREGDEEGDEDWANLGRFLAAITFIFLASLIAAISFVGLPSPNLPSIKFPNKQKEYALIAHSQSYWYAFDCDKNFLAISDKDSAGSIRISTSKAGCHKKTPGWERVTQAIESML